METRFERKWKIKEKYYNQIFFSLQNSKFKFSKLYEPRWVNSIYYDDCFFNSVKQNLDGVNKKKLRIRWYGNQSKTNSINLELKKKTGLIGTKQTKKIISKNFTFNKKNLIILREKIIKKYSFFINYHHTTSTRYLRQYFISQNKKIRATVDTKIEYRHLNLNYENIGKIRDDNLILEFKYNTKDDDYCRKNLQNNFLRITKNSKYANSFFYNDL